MAFPLSSLGLMPWMNQRETGDPKDQSIAFQYGDPIVFRWVEDGTAPSSFVIYANGSYTNVGIVRHYPWVRVLASIPGTTTYTYANRTALFANPPTAADQTALVTSDNSYWSGISSGIDNGNKLIWIPIRIRVSSGTTTAFGITASVYICTVPVDDLPKPSNRDRVSGGYYELCWQNNSMHAVMYDANFRILPAGYDLHKDIFDRTELNSRVAGEKALFEDEFITASQVEAGTGITLKWRKLDGSLTGYSSDATRGGNLVIEANAQAVTVEGAKTNAGIYYTGSIGTIQFRDKPMLVVEPNDTQIPIHSNVYTDDDGKTVVMQHAVHNNLYASRYDILGNITYPMALAGFGQHTIHHLRFNDSLDVTWSLTGVRIPTNTPEGTVYRKGIAVSANVNFPVAYTWSITDADNISPTTGVLTSNDTLTVDGVDGVTATVSVISATDIKLTVSRPVYAQKNGADVGNGSTLRFNFEDNWTETGRTPIRFDVVDTGFGVRRIRGSVADTEARDFRGNLSTIWYDTDGTNREIFRFGKFGAQYRREILIGPWGYQATQQSDADYAGTQSDANWDDQTFTKPNLGQSLFPVSQGYTKYARVSKAGLYNISATTQGKFWTDPSCAGNYKPGVNNHLHYFILTGRDINSLNIHKSVDIWHDRQLFGGYVNNVGPMFVGHFSSQTWSVQGTTLVWLEENDLVGHMVGWWPLPPENNSYQVEDRFQFSPRYHACEIQLVAAANEISSEYAKRLHKLYGRGQYSWYTQNF